MTDTTLETVRPFLFERGPLAPLIPARREAIVLALIPFVTTLLLYLLCLPSRIPGEHAGELVTAAQLLRIPHSPGHPLWCLLSRAFISVAPSGSPVWGVALGALLLGEPVSAYLAAGVGLVGTGLFLINRRAAWRPAAKPA